MRTGNLGKPGMTPKPPSAGVGKLAGLLAGIQSFDAERLEEIASATTGYYEARDAADKRIAVASEAEAKLVEAKAAHERDVRQTAETLDERQREVSTREGECIRREQNVTQREDEVTRRETVAGDAERRIARTREQLGEVG